MTDDHSDRDFADRAVRRLGQPSVPAGMEAALLAAYDQWNAKRGTSFGSGWKAALVVASDVIWPGAPLWAPASALAVALLVGAGLGVALPATMAQDQQSFSLEQPSSFSLFSSDLTQEGF
jgi:hypothetical protein